MSFSNSSLADVVDHNQILSLPLSDQDKVLLVAQDAAVERWANLVKAVAEQSELILRLQIATSDGAKLEQGGLWKLLSKTERNRFMIEIQETSVSLVELSHVIVQLFKSSKREHASEKRIDELIKGLL